jgi:hypothetical protein
MSTQCPKCGGQIDSSASECPHCGIVLAKFRTSVVPEDSWLVVVDGKEFVTDYLRLKAWIAEDRVKLTDRVKREGGPWRAASEHHELLITIATGDIHVPYDPIDAIFAFDSHTTGGDLLGGGAGDPNRAFDGVKRQLRVLCRQLGGHAVINCEFEYRMAVSAALLGSNQVVEIFAYGTAVRYKLPPPLAPATEA